MELLIALVLLFTGAACWAVALAAPLVWACAWLARRYGPRIATAAALTAPTRR